MMEKINVNLNIESSQQELEKMYDEVVNSPIGMQELKKMGIMEEKIKDNIVKIYDFVKDIEYCSSCPGVKKCKKNNPLLCTKLTYFNGFVERQLEPCKHLLEQVKYEGRFCFKDFDEKFNTISIKDKNFDFGKKRATIFKEFQSILKSNQKRWLFLSGKPQTGKTYLSIALLNYALTFKKVDGKIGFINTSFRFKELNDYSYSNKEEFNSMMQSLSNCEILIMDDFGNEYPGLYPFPYDLRYAPDIANPPFISGYMPGGSTYHDGKIYCNVYNDEANIQAVFPEWRVYDAETFELLSSHTLNDNCENTTVSLAYDMTTDVIYGLVKDYTDTHFVRIDPETGAMTRIATLDRLTDYYALACNKQGLVYGISVDNGGIHLIRVNKADGRTVRTNCIG